MAELGALVGFRIVSKKWTDQCVRVVVWIKKRSPYSQAFFLKRIKRRLKIRILLAAYVFEVITTINVQYNEVSLFAKTLLSKNCSKLTEKIDISRDLNNLKGDQKTFF